MDHPQILLQTQIFEHLCRCADRLQQKLNFVMNLIRAVHRFTDFDAQQFGIPLPQPVDCHSQSALSHRQTRADYVLTFTLFFAAEQVTGLFE